MKSKFDLIFLSALKVVKRVMRPHSIFVWKGSGPRSALTQHVHRQSFLRFSYEHMLFIVPSRLWPVGWRACQAFRVAPLGGDKGSPAMLRTSLWLLVRKVAAAHVARDG